MAEMKLSIGRGGDHSGTRLIGAVAFFLFFFLWRPFSNQTDGCRGEGGSITTRYREEAVDK